MAMQQKQVRHPGLKLLLAAVGCAALLAACSDVLTGTATLTPVGPLPYDAGNVATPDVLAGPDGTGADGQPAPRP